MGRSSLQNVLSLNDPAQTWNFDLFLPTIPGLSDSSNLTFKCMTTQLPAGMLDVVAVPIHGIVTNFAGRATYEHTLTATFLETSDYSTRDAFINWREMIRSWKNNSGSQKSVYAIPAQIVVYNDIPNVVKTINMYGVWPSNIAAVGMDGGTADIVKLDVTFTFDYFEDA